MGVSYGEKAAAQAARLAANTVVSDAQAKYGDDYGELRDEMDALLAGTTALPNEVLTDVLTADFDVDSGTTGATPTATGLSVSVGASKTYLFEATLFATATTNGGIELSLSYPTDTTGVFHTAIHQDANNIVNDGENAIDGVVNYIAAALSFDRIDITGYIVTSTTAGTFGILGAQDTEHADNTIIHQGSYIKLTPVA